MGVRVVTRYTDEQLLAAIHLALRARDMRAVAAGIRVLAVQAPEAAQAILDALNIARVVTS